MNIEKLQEFSSECEIKDGKLVIKSNLLKTLSFIKESYKFEILKEIIAVDCGEYIELIYNLFSSEHEENVLVSINVKESIESITSLFDSAVADEREIYDLFGVKFVGHEDLKRLYMPEGWNGHPLKKDYSINDSRLDWNE